MYNVCKVVRITDRIPPFVIAIYVGIRKLYKEVTLYEVFTDCRLRRGVYFVIVVPERIHQFFYDFSSLVSNCFLTPDFHTKYNYDNVETYLIHFVSHLPVSL